MDNHTIWQLDYFTISQLDDHTIWQLDYFTIGQLDYFTIGQFHNFTIYLWFLICHLSFRTKSAWWFLMFADALAPRRDCSRGSSCLCCKAAGCLWVSGRELVKLAYTGLWLMPIDECSKRACSTDKGFLGFLFFLLFFINLRNSRNICKVKGGGGKEIFLRGNLVDLPFLSNFAKK